MQYNFTIRKKDKGYQIIVSYKDGLKWKQKSKQGFTTQRDAKEYGNRIVEELKKTITNPLDDSLKDITLIEFWNIYISENKPRAFTTFKAYENAFYKFKTIHDYKIRDITELHIRNILNTLPNSIASKNLYRTVISQIFAYAVRPYRLIRFNPCENLKRLVDTKIAKIKVVSDEDISYLLSEMKRRNTKYYIICAIAAYTGMRYGEILGLTWNDIDFEERTIDVNKQFAYIDHKRYGIKNLKTKNSYRKIPIPPVLLDILEEYKQSSQSINLFKNTISNTGQISLVIKRYLPNTSIHDLRHTYATKLLANGVDVKTVSALLGDNLNTVIKIYVHYSDEMRLKATDSVAKIFG